MYIKNIQLKLCSYQGVFSEKRKARATPIHHLYFFIINIIILYAFISYQLILIQSCRRDIFIKIIL